MTWSRSQSKSSPLISATPSEITNSTFLLPRQMTRQHVRRRGRGRQARYFFRPRRRFSSTGLAQLRPRAARFYRHPDQHRCGQPHGQGDCHRLRLTVAFDKLCRELAPQLPTHAQRTDKTLRYPEKMLQSRVASVKWIIGSFDQDMAPVLAWARTFLDRFDTTALEWVRLDQGSSRYEGVYGQCVYPTKIRPTYHISCFAPGPFPGVTVTRKRPLYPRADGTFARAPRGCRRGDLCHDPRTGRFWYRVIGKTHLATLDQAIVWIVSHESFHFLRHTRQIAGRDNEIEADQFADDQLNVFRSQPIVEVSPDVTSAPPSGAQLMLPFVGG